MASSIYNEIESLTKSNLSFRFALELSNTTDPERKKNISNIISKLENKSNDELVKEKREKMFEVIDVQVFKQKWSRLQNFHKEPKILEYVNDNYKDHKNKDKLLEMLNNELKENKLKTEKFIKYDPNTTKITQIIGLVETDDDFKLEIKKKTVKKDKKNNDSDSDNNNNKTVTKNKKDNDNKKTVKKNKKDNDNKKTVKKNKKDNDSNSDSNTDSDNDSDNNNNLKKEKEKKNIKKNNSKKIIVKPKKK